MTKLNFPSYEDAMRALNEILSTPAITANDKDILDRLQNENFHFKQIDIFLRGEKVANFSTTIYSINSAGHQIYNHCIDETKANQLFIIFAVIHAHLHMQYYGSFKKEKMLM